VWYSDYARGKLGRLDPATGQVRDFASPGGDGSEPYAIAAGTDDGSGTTSPAGTRWWRSTSERALRDGQDPHARLVVRNMAVDSSRARLWLALSGVQKLGRIDLK